MAKSLFYLLAKIWSETSEDWREVLIHTADGTRIVLKRVKNGWVEKTRYRR